MKSKLGHLLVVVVVVLSASLVGKQALAESVTHDFVGTITSVTGTPFGLSLTVGDQVQGSFTYDTSQPPAFDTGQVAGYIQAPPSGMSVVISGVTLQSQDYNSFQVINDAYGVDNINGFFTPISVGGVLQYGWSSISFSLSDPTLTALSGTALPISIDFSSFSQRMGAIYDAGRGARVTFTVDPPTPPPVAVTIDIKPGGFPNAINPRDQGRTPVAVLTTAASEGVEAFDATTVNPPTVLFGSTGSEATALSSVLEDVDQDGDVDMLLFFNTRDTGIQCGDASATLTGETFDGQKLTGTDSIQTAGCW